MKPEFLKLRTHQGCVGPDQFFQDFELDFSVKGVTAILGASGVGKSTLLKALAGLLPDTSIQVQSSFSRMALMAQQDLLLPWLSVLDNVLLGHNLRGEVVQANRSLMIQSAIDLLDQVGLKKWIDAKPFMLSGGMRQRVALVRTLMEDAPLILMDEPFSALDLVNRYELQNLTAELLKEPSGEVGKTVVMVTHDPKEALRLADKVIVLGGFPAKIEYALDVSGVLGASIPRSSSAKEVLKQEAALIQVLLDIHANSLQPDQEG